MNSWDEAVCMNALEFTNLSKTFRGKKGIRVEALKNLSLTIGAGEVFGFLGPNGAGKSTTIKIIMGLIRPTSGKASIMGHGTGSAEARRYVGYLPENPAFYDYLNANEFLDFVGKAFKMEPGHLALRKEEVLSLLQLEDAGKRPIRGYSKGMVQRLGLAQVMLHDPDVYILDEPMSGLDPIGRALVKNIILDLKKAGKCVFFSTHITADVESVCDRVGIILNGVLQSEERVDAILTDGVSGYDVRVEHSGGEAAEFFVERDSLEQFLSEQRSVGHRIILVEPRRKNLEAFFLDIVKGKER